MDDDNKNVRLFKLLMAIGDLKSLREQTFVGEPITTAYELKLYAILLQFIEAYDALP
jgi:hypothetical protein